MLKVVCTAEYGVVCIIVTHKRDDPNNQTDDHAYCLPCLARYIHRKSGEGKEEKETKRGKKKIQAQNTWIS